ncbi:MAG TPA: NADH-quinone oxidoreductase subunit M, partial [Ohtaekwangia sp.]|nr:NADH-quinone oxidoreductase subunit M [Ohtaekwangia sp.]
MHQYLISLLIFTPLVAAAAALFIPARLKDVFRMLSLIASSIQLVYLVFILIDYASPAGPEGEAMRFVEQAKWITLDMGAWGVLQAEYFVGLDGLSLPLVGLSVVVMLIASISSWEIQKNVKGYFILLLILNAAVIGTFTALDFLLFYLFFEFMLLPMFFLIAMWGGP